jgi:hypothetical protein
MTPTVYNNNISVGRRVGREKISIYNMNNIDDEIEAAERVLVFLW